MSDSKKGGAKGGGAKGGKPGAGKPGASKGGANKGPSARGGAGAPPEKSKKVSRSEAGGQSVTTAANVAAAPKEMPRLQKHYLETVRAVMQKEFGYKNPMQVPRLDKIVINMGVGEAAGRPEDPRRGGRRTRH